MCAEIGQAGRRFTHKGATLPHKVVDLLVIPAN